MRKKRSTKHTIATIIRVTCIIFLILSAVDNILYMTQTTSVVGDIIITSSKLSNVLIGVMCVIGLIVSGFLSRDL